MKTDSKIIIGITPSYESSHISLNRLYCDYVISCGGLPVILPFFFEKNHLSDICQIIDGIIFSGGGDIAPSYYGENVLYDSSNTIQERDRYELSLINCILNNNIPFLGICRGIQLINVAMGGTLNQHITAHSETTHEININPETILYDLVKESKIKVNSFHHQSLKKIGNGLTISAYSNDGQTEAIELKNYPFGMGVQWHPERITIQNTTGHKLSIEIFSSLIKAAKTKS